MNTPYGLQVTDSCVNCALRSGFCEFSPDVLRHLDAIAHQQTYPPAATLFMEGQTARRVYVLCAGKIKMTTISREGKVFILRIAGPGEVLGISAALAEVPYEGNAVTITPCRVSSIRREQLVELMNRHGEAGVHAAKAVSRDYQYACEEIQEILMAPSSTGKIAKLLLSWSTRHGAEDREMRVRSLLTHEEMAQMIGSSRETVTRVLSDLRRKQLIKLEGSTLVIRNRTGLEDLAS